MLLFVIWCHAVKRFLNFPTINVDLVTFSLSYIFQLDTYNFTLSSPVNRALSGWTPVFLMLLATNVAIITSTIGVTEIIEWLFLNF